MARFRGTSHADFFAGTDFNDRIFGRAVRALSILAGLLLATPAHAQLYEKSLDYALPAGQTFAVRALCPQAGTLFLRALANGDWNSPLGEYGAGYCVNGRTGISFTVPTGVPFVRLYVGWSWPPNFSFFKLRIEPDCAGDTTTTCGLAVTNFVGRAAGRFTWPGDEDWFRLDGPLYLSDLRITTPRANCVAIGKVWTVAAVDYLVVSGGPAGCTYIVTGTERPKA